MGALKLNSFPEVPQPVVAGVRPEPQCSRRGADALLLHCLSERAGNFPKATQQ